SDRSVSLLRTHTRLRSGQNNLMPAYATSLIKRQALIVHIFRHIYKPIGGHWLWFLLTPCPGFNKFLVFYHNVRCVNLLPVFVGIAPCLDSPGHSHPASL